MSGAKKELLQAPPVPTSIDCGTRNKRAAERLSARRGSLVATKSISPALKDFIDTCIVPALLKVYFEDRSGETEKAA